MLRKEAEVSVSECCNTGRTQLATTGFEEEGGNSPRNADSLYQLEKKKKNRFCPEASRK